MDRLYKVFSLLFSFTILRILSSNWMSQWVNLLFLFPVHWNSSSNIFISCVAFRYFTSIWWIECVRDSSLFTLFDTLELPYLSSMIFLLLTSSVRRNAFSNWMGKCVPLLFGFPITSKDRVCKDNALLFLFPIPQIFSTNWMNQCVPQLFLLLLSEIYSPERATVSLSCSASQYSTSIRGIQCV